MKGLCDQSSQIGSLSPNEVIRIAQHVRKEGKDGVGIGFGDIPLKMKL